MNRYSTVIYKLIISCCILLASITTEAQNNTRSPYSMYGLGELKSQTNIVSSAMGSAGIAAPSSSYINMLNPASYQGLDSLVVRFDTGVEGKYSSFNDGGANSNLINGNYSYMAFAFRISPKFALGLGVNPYSSAGYEINSSASVEGTQISYPLDIIGTGDISRAYLALSYAPIKNLSIGVKSSFLFGKIDQTQFHNLAYLGSYSVYNLTTDYFYNFYFEFGAQYQFNVKGKTIGLGAVFTPSQNLLTHRETATYNVAGVVYDENVTGSTNYPMPTEIGFGLYMNDNKRFIYNLDAGMQYWENYSYGIKGARLKNNPYLRAGAEYTPSQNFLAPFLQRVNYRLGARYNQDYIQLRNQQLNDIAITCGLGIPLRKSSSRIDLSIEGGKYGTLKSGLIRENYLRVRVGFSLQDIWFQIRKFN